MSAVPDRRHMSLEEYLAFEEASEVRHEYYRGELFAMSGGTVQHVRIRDDFLTALNGDLRGGRCEAFSSDLRVKVSPTGLYTYADIAVACGGPRFEPRVKSSTLLNPVVLVEVLSDSTEAYDRGAKAAQYRQLESLREYVLVSQLEYRVEVFRREPNGPWMFFEYVGPDAVLDLPSLNCAIPLAEIYRRVDFSESSPEEDGPDEGSSSSDRD